MSRLFLIAAITAPDCREPAEEPAPAEAVERSPEEIRADLLERLDASPSESPAPPGEPELQLPLIRD